MIDKKIIKIKDKSFALSISSEEIQQAVKRVADAINRDYAPSVSGDVHDPSAHPLFICVLNGAFIFAGDLMKQIHFPCEITFVKLSSYDGLLTTGQVKEVIGLNESVVGRNVVVVEDIVDTGVTMEKIIQSLKAKGAADIRVCTFFQKPDALVRDIKVDYVAMKIPNDFIVGYGLDFDGFGRNYGEIYTLIDSE